jgi:hypothetical protein
MKLFLTAKVLKGNNFFYNIKFNKLPLLRRGKSDEADQSACNDWLAWIDCHVGLSPFSQ